jgi:hypothetical protein
VKTRLQRRTLLRGGDEDVNRHCNPKLSFDGILAISVKRLDSEVRLDPLEEQFHRPTGLVQQADRQRWEVKVIGEETQMAGYLDLPLPRIIQERPDEPSVSGHQPWSRNLVL